MTLGGGIARTGDDMPYFERRPYREMMTEDAAARGGVAPEEAFAGLAREVLSSETAPRQAIDGPFRVVRPTAPGETGRLTLSIAADERGGPLTLDFTADDLRGPEPGAAIPAGNIAVAPATASVRPGGAVDVTVTIQAPKDAAPGLYRGRIRGEGTEPLALAVEIEIS